VPFGERSSESRLGGTGVSFLTDAGATQSSASSGARRHPPWRSVPLPWVLRGPQRCCSSRFGPLAAEFLLGHGRVRGCLFGERSSESRLGGWGLFLTDAVATQSSVSNAPKRDLHGDRCPTVGPPWAATREFKPFRADAADFFLGHGRLRGYLSIPAHPSIGAPGVPPGKSQKREVLKDRPNRRLATFSR
jgi:hypothetical protein